MPPKRASAQKEPGFYRIDSDSESSDDSSKYIIPWKRKTPPNKRQRTDGEKYNIGLTVPPFDESVQLQLNVNINKTHEGRGQLDVGIGSVSGVEGGIGVTSSGPHRPSTSRTQPANNGPAYENLIHDRVSEIQPSPVGNSIRHGSNNVSERPVPQIQPAPVMDLIRVDANNENIIQDHAVPMDLIRDELVDENAMDDSILQDNLSPMDWIRDDSLLEPFNENAIEDLFLEGQPTPMDLIRDDPMNEEMDHSILQDQPMPMDLVRDGESIDPNDDEEDEEEVVYRTSVTREATPQYGNCCKRMRFLGIPTYFMQFETPRRYDTAAIQNDEEPGTTVDSGENNDEEDNTGTENNIQNLPNEEVTATSNETQIEMEPSSSRSDSSSSSSTSNYSDHQNSDSHSDADSSDSNSSITVYDYSPVTADSEVRQNELDDQVQPLPRIELKRENIPLNTVQSNFIVDLTREEENGAEMDDQPTLCIDLTEDSEDDANLPSNDLGEGLQTDPESYDPMEGPSHSGDFKGPAKRGGLPINPNTSSLSSDSNSSHAFYCGPNEFLEEGMEWINQLIESLRHSESTLIRNPHLEAGSSQMDTSSRQNENGFNYIWKETLREILNRRSVGLGHYRDGTEEIIRSSSGQETEARSTNENPRRNLLTHITEQNIFRQIADNSFEPLTGQREEVRAVGSKKTHDIFPSSTYPTPITIEPCEVPQINPFLKPQTSGTSNVVLIERNEPSTNVERSVVIPSGSSSPIECSANTSRNYTKESGFKIPIDKISKNKAVFRMIQSKIRAQRMENANCIQSSATPSTSSGYQESCNASSNVSCTAVSVQRHFKKDVLKKALSETEECSAQSHPPQYGENTNDKLPNRERNREVRSDCSTGGGYTPSRFEISSLTSYTSHCVEVVQQRHRKITNPSSGPRRGQAAYPSFPSRRISSSNEDFIEIESGQSHSNSEESQNGPVRPELTSGPLMTYREKVFRYFISAEIEEPECPPLGYDETWPRPFQEPEN